MCLGTGAAIRPKGISMDIEPDDMEAEDTVTVVWEIIINEK